MRAAARPALLLGAAAALIAGLAGAPSLTAPARPAPGTVAEACPTAPCGQPR